MRRDRIPVLVRILQMILSATVVVTVVLISSVTCIDFWVKRVLKRLRIFVKERFRVGTSVRGKVICWNLLRMAAGQGRVCSWKNLLERRRSVVYEKRRLRRVARRCLARVRRQRLLKNGIDVSERSACRRRVVRIPVDLSGNKLFVEKGASYYYITAPCLYKNGICAQTLHPKKQTIQSCSCSCACTYLRGELVDREVELYCTHTVAEIVVVVGKYNNSNVVFTYF